MKDLVGGGSYSVCVRGSGVSISEICESVSEICECQIRYLMDGF